MKSSAKILSLVLTLVLALAVFAPAAMAKTYVTEKSSTFRLGDVKRREPAAEATEAEAAEAAEAKATEAAEATEAEAEAAEAETAEATEAEAEAEATEAEAAEAAEAEAAEATPAEAVELPANARLMAIIEDELNAARSVSIYAAYEGDTLSFGDAVTLIAVLNGYESTVYELQWQVSPDDQAWTDVAGETAASYAFTIDESNYTCYWRVAVTITGVVVPDEVLAAANAENAEK